MPVKVYKVIETTDALQYIRTFFYGMTDGYNDATYAYYEHSQDASNFAGLWLTALQNGRTYSGGTGYDYTYSSFIGNLALSNWIQLSGMACRDIENLAVGRRFYFADQLYVRISEITKYTQYGVGYIRVGWTYFKNGNSLGTITNEYLHQAIDTSYSNSMRVYAIPLIPYDAKLWIGGSVSNQHVYPYGQYFAINTGSNPYLQISSGPGFSNSPAWLQTFFAGVEPVDMDDPYVNIPDSEPSGPAEGTGIPDSDPVDIPTTPTVSVTDTGFVGLFNPTLQQVQDLADYMWTGLFDLNTFKKIFADPMDCILGFNMVPVDVPSGSPAAVRVGNISTGVQMNVATSQWVEVDCGNLTIDLPYGSYLDYAPYSKFSLYLPYIGIVELSTDDVVGKTLTLKYHVDILSCSCVAFLKCGDSVLYQFTGSCGYSIPLTGDSFRQTVANVVSIAATVGGVVASGGISAPAAVAAGASITSNVMNSKPEIHRSGSIGSSAGLLGIQTPYLIMELPHACKPKKQYHYLGYPGFITAKVGDISGYAEFESVILDGIGCTSEERQMIESYCSGGIYV